MRNWTTLPGPERDAPNSPNRTEQKATTVYAHSCFQDKHYFYVHSTQTPPRCYSFPFFISFSWKSSCISDHSIYLSLCVHTAVKQCSCRGATLSSCCPVLGDIFIYSYTWKKIDGDFNSSESGQMLLLQYAKKPPKCFFSVEVMAEAETELRFMSTNIKFKLQFLRQS